MIRNQNILICSELTGECDIVDFIWRTDFVIRDPSILHNFANDTFETNMRKIIDPVDRSDCLPLNILDSRWVDSLSLYGPTGLVSPTGSMRMQRIVHQLDAKVLMKDVRTINAAFPGLTGHIYIWDYPLSEATAKGGVLPNTVVNITHDGATRTDYDGPAIAITSDVETCNIGFQMMMGNAYRRYWTIDQFKEFFESKLR